MSSAARGRAALSALWLTLLVGCGASPWPMTWLTSQSEAPSVDLPLVEVWQPAGPASRVLVEGWIGDQGPYLFAVDGAVPGVVLARRIAEIHELPWRHAPGQGGVTTLPRLSLGASGERGLRLSEIQCALSPYESFGEFHERPVVGVIGAPLLTHHAVELDPGRGVLRVWTEPPPAPPVGASELTISPRGDGPGWVVEIALVGEEEAPEARPWHLAFGRGFHTVYPDAAAELPLGRSQARPAALRGTARLPGRGDVPVTLELASGPSEVSGQLSHEIFGAGAVVRVDAGGKVWWWPSTAAPLGAMARFDDRLPCTARARACPVVRIEEVREDALSLIVEVAEPPVAPRYWWRVNLGTEEEPLAPLLWAHPLAPGPITATVALPPGIAERISEEGGPLPVLDVVPTGAPCAGKLCVSWPARRVAFPH